MTVANVSSSSASEGFRRSDLVSDSSDVSEIPLGQRQSQRNDQRQSDDDDIITVHGSDSESDSDYEYDTEESRTLGEDDTGPDTTTDTASDRSEYSYRGLPPFLRSQHLPEVLLGPVDIICAIDSAFQHVIDRNQHYDIVMVSETIRDKLFRNKLCCWTCQRNTPNLRSMSLEFMDRHVEIAVTEAFRRYPLYTFCQHRYVVEALLSIGSFGDLARFCPCTTCW